VPAGGNPKAFILSSGNLSEKPSPVRHLSVDGLADQFIDWAASYYIKDGQPTNQVLIIRLALKVLRDLHGREPALSFGPLALKECREVFIKPGLARTECNRRVRIIVQAFRWGVENALIPAVNLEVLKAVRSLSKGRSAAHETEPVAPVPEDDVDKTLPLLTEQVGAMVELQRLTGMRPNEVIQMTTGGLTMTGSVWEYVPPHH
jgi:hypothetical protein